MQKYYALIILLAVSGLFWGSPVHAQLLQLAVSGRVVPLPGSQVWHDSAQDLTFPLHFHTRIKPRTLLIGRDHPNSVRFLALFPGRGIPLPLRFDKNFRGFDDFGDLKPGYLIQVAEHHFGKESVPQIIVAVGNGRDDLAVNVVAYHAPKLARNRNQQSNWILDGSFSGQITAIISAGILTLPAGPQQKPVRYKWVSGRFVEERGDQN
jgi:hypothetical protein